MRKSKKCFSASQRHCLRNLLHQHLVEPDQITMFYQLFIINVVYMRVGKCYPGRPVVDFSSEAKPFFYWGAKNDEYLFFPLETKKTTFLLKIR